MIRVFLGGTTKGYDWREVLEERFAYVKFLELYNPIVKDWNEESREKENLYKETADINLYVVTPFMGGCYSIAEAVDSSNKYPEKTVFAYISEAKHGNEIRRFTKEMTNSLNAVSEIITTNGGTCLTSLDEVIDYIREYINR